MQKTNSFAHLVSSLNQDLGSVSTDLANLSCRCKYDILYGASLEPVHSPELCSLGIPVISSTIEENLSFAIAVKKTQHKPLSLSRLLVKLQELNYNLKVKVLFDKYVAFFSSLCMLMVSSPRVQKSRRQSYFKC